MIQLLIKHEIVHYREKDRDLLIDSFYKMY